MFKYRFFVCFPKKSIFKIPADIKLPVLDFTDFVTEKVYARDIISLAKEGGYCEFCNVDHRVGNDFIMIKGETLTDMLDKKAEIGDLIGEVSFGDEVWYLHNIRGAFGLTRTGDWNTAVFPTELGIKVRETMLGSFFVESKMTGDDLFNIDVFADWSDHIAMHGTHDIKICYAYKEGDTFVVVSALNFSLRFGKSLITVTQVYDLPNHRLNGFYADLALSGKAEFRDFSYNEAVWMPKLAKNIVRRY